MDPAVRQLPYGANIDIRDTVNYKEVCCFAGFLDKIDKPGLDFRISLGAEFRSFSAALGYWIKP
jgi:hypothetical protein